MPTILIADDNQLSLRFFAEAVAGSGYSCETAADGEMAVALAEERAFDLLLLDARMPRLDGVQALQRIRAGNGPSRKAKAVATTAAERKTHPALLAAGFLEVVGKPVSLPDLRAMLDRCLGSPIHDGRPAMQSVSEPLLVQTGAGFDTDPGILAALRGLFALELDVLPNEIADYASKRDIDALRDRLHRLDASAGFCAAPALAKVSQAIRHQLDAGSAWPEEEIDLLLDCSLRTRSALT